MLHKCVWIRLKFWGTLYHKNVFTWHFLLSYNEVAGEYCLVCKRYYVAVLWDCFQWQELVMVVWFTTEFIVRVWSAGCRSRYTYLWGRARFIRRPLCIVGTYVLLTAVAVYCGHVLMKTAVHCGYLYVNDRSGMVPSALGARFYFIMEDSLIWPKQHQFLTAFGLSAYPFTH